MAAPARCSAKSPTAWRSTGSRSSRSQIALPMSAVHDAAFLESGGARRGFGIGQQREYRLFLAGPARRRRYGRLQRHRAGSRTPPPHGSTRLRRRHARPPQWRSRAPGTGVLAVAGVPIEQNAALLEGGLDWRLTAQIKLGVGYQGELGQHAQTKMAKGTSIEVLRRLQCLISKKCKAVFG